MTEIRYKDTCMEKESKGSNAKNIYNVEAVRAVREILSSMIQNPVYESDETIIGKKNFLRYEQTPIVTGKERKLVEDKLLALVSEL